VHEREGSCTWKEGDGVEVGQRRNEFSMADAPGTTRRKRMKMRATVMALVVAGIACAAANESDVVTSEEAQIVEVTVEGSEYLFSPASVQAESPVRLVFDPNGVPGCSRSVTLPDYDITKTIEEGDATIEFTPKGKGPIAVACTMNMYTGTLVAE
jgi:plastocyanin domain-containing protein